MNNQRHELCDQCDKGYRANGHQDETPVRKKIAIWNANHPEGTPVAYENIKDSGEWVNTKTRSVAWFASYSAIVKIEGRAGGCSIDHMIPTHGAQQ